MHPLDQALALQAQGEGRWHGRTHPDWANMVGPFGGITAAQLLQAAMLDPRALGEPLALTVNYAPAWPTALRDRGRALAHQPQHAALAR
jgi:hypothetical protein